MAVILHTETFGAGPSLSMIHGWGAQNSVWRDWAQQYLASDFEVRLIELPGFGDSPKIDATAGENINQAWLDAIAAVLPAKTTLLGWSLGGLMAQQLALTLPDRIEKLICLTSTPRFVQADGWAYAINPELMADFIKALGLDSLALLNRFWKIQLQGSDGARQLMKHLLSQMKGRSLPSFTALLQGLELLRDIDLRDDLVNLRQPTLWVLGEHDPLIPQALIAQLASLQPCARLEVIQGAAHVPFMSHPQQVAQVIKTFINEGQDGL